MKLIRHSVFETNSSSSHSISIDNQCETYSTITPDESGVIILGTGEYGWDFDTFCDAYSKADYCALDNLYNEYRLEMLSEVIREHTGAISVIFTDTGYIDHQNLGTTKDAFESKETLKNFIFNRTSVLETGNDNC